jgi:hypothetical protein
MTYRQKIYEHNYIILLDKCDEFFFFVKTDYDVKIFQKLEIMHLKPEFELKPIVFRTKVKI